MFSYIHVITRNWKAKPNESDWSIFFLIGQFFILKKLQLKIHFWFWDARSRWPGLVRCCMRALCAILHNFCAAVCFLFLLMHFQCVGLLSGVKIVFFDLAISKLVMQFCLHFPGLHFPACCDICFAQLCACLLLAFLFFSYYTFILLLALFFQVNLCFA